LLCLLEIFLPPSLELSLHDPLVESWIVATKDRTVQPELQRFVAKLMGATSYEAESSHVPMLSNSDLVIDVIRTAAESIVKSD
jgi:hypothetical protein